MAWGRGIQDAIRFGFSVGRIRVLEGRLLTNATLERLIDAPDFLAQKRVLADTEYGAVVAKCETATEVEKALEDHICEVYTFLETSRLPKAIVDYFRIPYDYRNMKARLKAEALDVPLAGMLSTHGTLPVEVFSGPVELLPEHLRHLDAKVRASDGTVDRLRIDRVVDVAMYAAMLSAAKESECRLLVRIAQLDTDLANVRTILRARQMGWSVDDAAMALTPGGQVPIEDLVRGYNMALPELSERIASVARFPGVRAEDLETVERFDVIADDLLMREAKKGRLAATGVEPVVGYVMARRSEVVILRTLLIGKIAGLGADALRARVRKLYA